VQQQQLARKVAAEQQQQQVGEGAWAFVQMTCAD
jgi:hypothetical protein